MLFGIVTLMMIAMTVIAFAGIAWDLLAAT
jgi:hypothetical protein